MYGLDDVDVRCTFPQYVIHSQQRHASWRWMKPAEGG